MIQAHEIAALKIALPMLSPKDRDFAQSLISGKYGYETRGYLSDKQAPYVHSLIAKAAAPKPETKTVQVGSLVKLHDLFDMAGKGLKFPAIVLKVGERNVKLYRAGAKAKVPGAINVVDRAADLWFGRITKEGVWEVSAKTDAQTEASLKAVLGQLSRNPAQVAAQHGKLTGECCFCAKALTDTKSTDVGYGLICAKKWGLAWGGKA